MRKLLRLPSQGEIRSWSFTTRNGVLQLVINVVEVDHVRKLTGIKVPVECTLHYHSPSQTWYADGDKLMSKPITEIMQDISNRLAIGMKRAEWERAVPTLWRTTASLTVYEAMARYLQIRVSGNDYHRKGGAPTIHGIKAAQNCWKSFGKDMDIFRLKHAMTIESEAKREIEDLLRKFLSYMRDAKLSVATQKVHLFYIKSAIKAMAHQFDLFMPDGVDKVQVNVASPEVLVIDNMSALEALANLSIVGKKDSAVETILCAKIMLFSGLRIGDAAALTLHNFIQTDQGIVLRIVTSKTKRTISQSVPDAIWADIQHCLRRWKGQLVYVDSGSRANTDRIRNKMRKIVAQLPGMNDEIQVVKQNPDGSKYTAWTTLAKEFRPHMLRRTSGTINHRVTGKGHEHLGNGQDVFEKHYLGINQDIINMDTQRKFHVALGLIPAGQED